MRRKPLRVLVCGSRTWDRPAWIGSRLAEFPKDTEVIHGGARGVDTIAANYAYKIGLKVTEYPADWHGQGKAAGIIRNGKMLDARPDLVIAFWDGESRGTRHTIEEARRRGIRVEVHTRKGIT